MRRPASAAIATALLVAIVLATAFLSETSRADYDTNTQVFTSRVDQIRIVVPRAWRATDQPSYPGLLLWMMRNQPTPGQIVLTAETFTRDLYCSWPVACRTSHETPTQKYACALRTKLK